MRYGCSQDTMDGVFQLLCWLANFEIEVVNVHACSSLIECLSPEYKASRSLSQRMEICSVFTFSIFQRETVLFRKMLYFIFSYIRMTHYLSMRVLRSCIYTTISISGSTRNVLKHRPSCVRPLSDSRAVFTLDSHSYNISHMTSSGALILSFIRCSQARVLGDAILSYAYSKSHVTRPLV